MADDSTLLQGEQAAKVITNNLLLRDSFDNSNALMAIKFGGDIQESDGEDADFTLRFKATEAQGNFAIDRHLLNFVCTSDESGAVPAITFNNYKIWNETNDGPNSGLNADLLDGRHATEFKDRYGYHHFVHQVAPANKADEKNWVKIATLSVRRIGTRTDLNYDATGVPAYGGVFKYSGNGVFGVSTDDVVIPGGNIQSVTQALATMDIREQFKLNTPPFIDEYDPDVFHTTNILTEGVYNGTLRGCVTLLKDDNPTTFDFHLGLFENSYSADTKDTGEDGGWTAVKKYFYVSLHDETLPFLTDDVVYTISNDDDNLNKGFIDESQVNEDTDDLNNDKDNGIVNDAYSASYPKFPQYSWGYEYTSGQNGGHATKIYQNDVLGVPAATTNAMANLYFTKPDGKKAEMLRKLKLTYGNDYKLALESELERLKKLGLAMADVDNSGSSNGASDPKVELDNEVKEFQTIVHKADGENDDKFDSGDFDDNVKDTAVHDAMKAQDGVKKTLVDMNNLKDVHNGPLSRIDIDKPDKRGYYKYPPATMQDVEPYNKTRMRKPFPPANSKGEKDAYQTYIDIMRLYHIATRVDMVDGVEVVTHIYELYMAIDKTMEIRIQPYMSTGCLMYNFNECIQTADLPKDARFIRPKSIYDNRYASVRHRHYDYERRIWELSLEADQMWKNFQNYVKLDQGIDNANKVLLTDRNGKVYPAEDNMVRHSEPTDVNKDTGEGPRRTGGRVLITTDPNVNDPAHKNDITPNPFNDPNYPITSIENTPPSDTVKCSCVDESDITIYELYQLKGITHNIEDELGALWTAIETESGKIWDGIEKIWEALDKLGNILSTLEGAMGNFVRKTGDIMTGSLWIQYDGNTFKEGPTEYESKETFGGVKFFSNTAGAKHGGYLYGATGHTSVGLGVQKYPGRDREPDWVLAIQQQAVDSGVACSFNGSKLSFAIDGRKDDANDTNTDVRTIDFERLYDWYHEVTGHYFDRADD